MNAEVCNQTTTNALTVRRGRKLEVLSIGCTLIEAVVGIVAGIAAGSASLVGFGLDSIIEIASSLTLLWRLRTGEKGERREKTALRIVGASFLLLAAYIGFDAGKSLYFRERPETSVVGVGLAVFSLIAMPLLARAKRRVANDLNSRAMLADSRQASLCAYLSAILLVGLLLNWLFGWWWADPTAALVMTPIIVREGLEALRGKHCEDCH